MPFSKYSPKQKKLARIAEPRDVINEADFAVLNKKPKKMAGGGKLSSRVTGKKRYDNAIKRIKKDTQNEVMANAIKRKLADIQERTSGIKDFDEQEFKVKDIPTPKI